MDHSELKDDAESDQPKESFLKVIVHSFFVIPFLIAVFGLLLFAAMHLLTSEKRSAQDYLKDVKTGSETKRWQSAFELSKMLSNPKALPEDSGFYQDMLSAFEQSRHDSSPLVRQYLALAMGRSGKTIFVTPLIKALKDADDANRPTIIYALGMLKEPKTAGEIEPYLNDPDARVRSIAATALGNIANPASKSALKKVLNDPEPNAQWGAAISLAGMGDDSGKTILLKLLSRDYLAKFSEVDAGEQTQLMLAAVEAAAKIKDEDLMDRLTELSKTDRNMKVRAQCLKAISH